MSHLTQVNVSGLFDSFDHRIKLSGDSEATIISGPNGTGKTHTLRLLKAAFDFDCEYLRDAPFRSLELHFRDGAQLNITRQAKKFKLPANLLFSGRTSSGRRHELTVQAQPEAVDGSLFVASAIDLEYVADKYVAEALRLMRNRESSKAKPVAPRWLRQMTGCQAFMIETKRLHISPREEEARQPVRGKKRSVLESHIERLDWHVSQARDKSLRVTQELDQTFPMRVLWRSEEGSQRPITAASLSRLSTMYAEVQKIGEELHSIGLSAMPELIKIPTTDVTQIERRILTLFVRDWRRKLQPLQPIGDRLAAFRDILNDKLRLKTVSYHATNGLQFKSDITGEVIPVDSLSSGEQHLLVLFASLLFSAPSGAVVLIDEPEISMHAAWKHAFLDDMNTVSEIHNLQVILATHSTSIIRGRWDLVSEIGVAE
ncbi:AAA family ATPase [Streptomyces xanthophaeus]